MKDYRKHISDRENSRCDAGMSLGVSLRNLTGDIKWVAGYRNLELNKKVSRNKDLGVTGIRWHLKQWN